MAQFKDAGDYEQEELEVVILAQGQELWTW